MIEEQGFIRQKKLLQGVLWLAVVVPLLIAVNVRNFPRFAISLSIISIVSLGMLFLNRKGYYTSTAIGLLLLVSASTTYNSLLIETNHNWSLITYPIIVVFGSMLLGRKAIPWITLLCVVLVLGIFVVDISGLMVTSIHEPVARDAWQDLITISVLIVATGLLLSIIMGLIDDSLTRVLDSEEKLKEAYDFTMIGWAKALELHDNETEGHSRRVTELTIEVATAMGVIENNLPDIRRGALLHDIGKMGIPAGILLKPGPLTADEELIMQRHPTYAKEMLAGIPYLQGALDIPYYHHERWDGSGYPEGLRGKVIPLAARIFAVVDVWDALRSSRPYSESWSEDQARQYIVENSGILFDSQVVEAFFRVLGY